MDACLVMGKELRGDPNRGWRELRARAAAASARARETGAVLMSLEANLKGQDRSGSAIVAEMWGELGWDKSSMILENQTYSTRQEAMLASEMMEKHELSKLSVFTATYHQKRTRALFAEHLDLDRFEVMVPEDMLGQATIQEKHWIRGGSPSATVVQFETRKERLWTLMNRLSRPLPDSLRWRLECSAGRLLRKAAE